MAVHVAGIFAVNAEQLFGTDKALLFRTTVTRNTKAVLGLKPKNFTLAVVNSPPAFHPDQRALSARPAISQLRFPTTTKTAVIS